MANRYVQLAKQIAARRNGAVRPRVVGPGERAELLAMWRANAPRRSAAQRALAVDDWKAYRAALDQERIAAERKAHQSRLRREQQQIAKALAAHGGPWAVYDQEDQMRRNSRRNSMAEMELIGEDYTGLFPVTPVGRANRARRNAMASMELRGMNRTGYFPVTAVSTPVAGFGRANRGRANVTKRGLELLEQLRASGQIGSPYAEYVTQLYPQRNAVNELDKFLKSSRKHGALGAFKQSDAYKAVRQARAAERRAVGAELSAAQREAKAAMLEARLESITDAFLLDLAKSQIKALRRQPKKSKSPVTARNNSGGVTGLALAMPRSNGRRKMAKLTGAAKQRFLAKMAAGRARAAGRRPNPSRSRAAELIAAGDAYAPTPAALRKYIADEKRQAKLLAKAKVSTNKKFGFTVRNKGAKIEAALSDPSGWVIMRKPSLQRVWADRAGARRPLSESEANRVRDRIARIEARLKGVRSTRERAAKLSLSPAQLEERVAQAVALGISEAAARRRFSSLSRPRKASSKARAIKPERLGSVSRQLARLQGYLAAGQVPVSFGKKRGKSAAAARANRRRNFDLAGVGSGIGAAIKAKPLAFGLSAVGGAVGFSLLSNLVRKWAPSWSDNTVRWGVGLGLGLGFLSGWKFFGKVGSRATQLGLGVGFLVAAAFRDTISGWLNKILPESLRPMLAPAGFGSVYDRAFDDLDGFGRYVAQGVGNVNVTGAPAGVGRYVATGEYLADPWQGQGGAFGGLGGVNVQAAVAGGVPGGQNPFYAPVAGTNGRFLSNDIANEVAAADNLNPSDRAMEGLGQDDGTTKLIYADAAKAAEIQGSGRYNLRLLRESAQHPGVWIVGIERSGNEAMTPANGIAAITPRPTERQIDAFVGRSVVPRGVFETSVFGQHNGVFAAIN